MTSKDIREIRNKLGVSQTAFAYLLNISFSTLNRWENDKSSPDEESVNKLQGLKELLEQDGIDKRKLLESIKTVGITSALTIGTVAGLIRSPAMAALLGPLGIAGGALASLAYLFKKKKNGE